MSISNKTKMLFYLILSLGVLVFSVFLYLSYFIFDGIKLVWLSVLGKLETICGCSSHFVFSNHPYLFTFLILSFFVVFFFLVFIFLKAYLLKRKTSLFMKEILSNKKNKLSQKLEAVVKKSELSDKVVELTASDIEVFCAGLLRPKIYLSNNFVENLDQSELEAVVLHEQHHVMSFDPLRYYTVKTINNIFFFIPLFAYLSGKFYTSAEIAADEWVISKMKEKKSLTRAVYRSIENSERAILRNGLMIPLFDDITEERVNKIVDNHYVLDIKQLSLRLLSFVLFFAVSMSAYSSLILLGDNVVSTHNETSCAEHAGESSCEMTESDSCEMHKEKKSDSYFCEE